MRLLFHQWIQRALAVLVILAGGATARAAEFRDRFAERETVTSPTGQLEGNNTDATIEAEEPRHGGKRPAHSLWISWIAPTNGLATVQLTGTGFDTLLGIYQLEPGDDPPLRRLEKVAENDDDRQQTASRIQFGVRAGEQYEIAVDGFASATGPLRLTWDLQPTTEIIPRVSVVTGDRAATVGETVTLAVTLGPGVVPKLHWFFNDQELEDEEELTLVIPNFRPANVGQYQVRVEVGDVDFFSESVELQISSEGTITTLARNKPEDALDSPLIGAGALAKPARVRLAPAGVRPAGGPGGLTRGYNGTQIFNTVFAGRDVNEPLHCGLAGGASYWFAYESPAAGELELDTDGSAFDTVLEVYTFDPPLLGYQSLRSLACDNNGGANGVTSKLTVACESGRTYLVVVDGVNGARGLTYLNYQLATNLVASVPPSFGDPLPPMTARVGDLLTLAPVATGTPPLRYVWRKDAVELPGETNASLILNPVQLMHAGQYTVEVSNSVGVATNSPVSVAVWGPPVFVLQPGGSGGQLQFPAAGPLQFTVESSAEMSGTNWVSSAATNPLEGQVIIPVPFDTATQFFRVRFDASP